LLAIAVGTFLAVALTTKVITGEERLTYYHHQLAILGASALFLALTGRPLLAYLDVLAAGIGGFLVCGRVGCYLVGCCHGRPARWGVVYGTDHAGAGLPGAFVGVPLVPVQLIESVAVACIVALTVRPSAPGAGLVVALVGYGGVRFCLEWLRGDARPSFVGLSEAQWTSVLLASSVAAARLAGVR
jgi:prolipoprotein diacylglyceryltransferase